MANTDISLVLQVVDILVTPSSPVVQVSIFGALGMGPVGRLHILTTGLQVIDDVLIALAHFVGHVFVESSRPLTSILVDDGVSLGGLGETHVLVLHLHHIDIGETVLERFFAELFGEHLVVIPEGVELEVVLLGRRVFLEGSQGGFIDEVIVHQEGE